MRRTNILELERNVKKEYATDKSSGDFYLAVKDLAAGILLVKRMVDKVYIQDIAHMLAVDIYERVNYKGTTIKSWTKYIQLRLLAVRSSYYKETQCCELEVIDPVELEEFSKYVSYSANALNEIRVLETEDFIKILPKVAIKYFDKIIRYLPSTDEYRQLKLSVMQSVINKTISKDYVYILGLDYYKYYSYLNFLINYILLSLNDYYKLHNNVDESYSLNQIITTESMFEFLGYD